MTAEERAHVERANRRLIEMGSVHRSWRDELLIIIGLTVLVLLAVLIIARAIWVFGGGA